MISLIFCYVTRFYRKSNPRTAVNREDSITNNWGERFSWEMNNFCKMNFSDSQKIFCFEPHSDSDSSATDQKSIIFREIHQNTSVGRIFLFFCYVTRFYRTVAVGMRLETKYFLRIRKIHLTKVIHCP